MIAIEREIACVILRNGVGKICLQLRDDLAHIVAPNQWCLFGGGLEGNESPKEAAQREIYEELNLRLDPNLLAPVGAFYHKPTRIFHIFVYESVPPFEEIVLGEGQDWGLFSAETILSGKIHNKTVVPHHRAIIDWFTNQHLPNHQL